MSQNKIADQRRLTACKAIKMTADTIELIDSKIKERWSPEQISGWLKKDQSIYISYETIYQHIWADKQCSVQLFTFLRRKGKVYQSRSKDKQAGRGYIKKRVSVDERPQVVDDKSRIGDWEIDLVIGKGHSGALLTISSGKPALPCLHV
ncbi:MAG: IS30 family transposase [Oceanospirillaceae bacterium]|jgi:IS30 family transposase